MKDKRIKGLEYKQNSWFFEKINKMYKPLAKLIKKEKIQLTLEIRKLICVAKETKEFNTNIKKHIQFYAEILKP